jgi:hypothetical protein
LPDPLPPPQPAGAPPNQPGGDPPRAVKADLLVIVRKFWNESYLPRDEHYRLLTKAVAVIFAVAVLPLYYVGANDQTAQLVVYWIWRTSLFGLWSDTIPYACSDGVFCARGRYVEAHLPLAALFFVAGLISIRLLALCLEMLERALGTNLIARLLDKYLPEKRADPPAK